MWFKPRRSTSAAERWGASLLQDEQSVFGALRGSANNFVPPQHLWKMWKLGERTSQIVLGCFRGLGDRIWPVRVRNSDSRPSFLISYCVGLRGNFRYGIRILSMTT